MKDLKAHIIAKLLADPTVFSIVNDNVKAFSDDKSTMENFDSRLPQITIARLFANVNHLGLRSESVQISSWAHYMGESQDLAKEVERVFHMTSDEVYKSCRIRHYADTFDRKTGAHSLHLTFEFVVMDAD